MFLSMSVLRNWLMPPRHPWAIWEIQYGGQKPKTSCFESNMFTKYIFWYWKNIFQLNAIKMIIFALIWHPRNSLVLKILHLGQPRKFVGRENRFWIFGYEFVINWHQILYKPPLSAPMSLKDWYKCLACLEFCFCPQHQTQFLHPITSLWIVIHSSSCTSLRSDIEVL